VLCFIAGAIRFLIHFLSPLGSLAAVSASGSSVMALAHTEGGEEENPLVFPRSPEKHICIHTISTNSSRIPPYTKSAAISCSLALCLFGFIIWCLFTFGLRFLLFLFWGLTDLINEHIALTGYLLFAPTDLF